MKNISHSKITKGIFFLLMIAFFVGMVNSVVKITTVPYRSLLQKSYFESGVYLRDEVSPIIGNLTTLMTKYKNEEEILAGETISKNDWRIVEEELYDDFVENSERYNPEQSNDHNYKIFKEEYSEEIKQARKELIHKELRTYHRLLQNLEVTKMPLFYASDGTNVYTNTTMEEREQFEAYPAYFIFENYNQEFSPKETKKNPFLDEITDEIDRLDPENTIIYLAFSDEYLAPKLAEWKANSKQAADQLEQLIIYVPGFIFTFFYLAVVVGRKSFKDTKIHLNLVDKLYTDLNLILCIFLISLFISLLDFLFGIRDHLIVPMMIPIAIVGLTLVMSLVKHLKNKTLIKHSLIYIGMKNIVQFFGDVYRSGNLAVKTVMIVIGYPLLIAATFFMFPITIGVAAWFAYKKVKSFQKIQEGVEIIKEGNLQYRIDVDGNGEFNQLAENINTITDGLKNAVDRELKSERLKTELITNVSHDIRTPLTSIITYVDLLKQEEDPTKAKEYIEVLEQKSQRLKTLTDDLFDAAKASSGDIPVQLEKIDVVSLINQGIGEVSEKLEERFLQLKLNGPKERIYVMADGRLLWRSIDNLLSNIIKYALSGSRVYINIEDDESTARLTFKNISETELNISPDELMERFKRGDEARTTEGSGLGLSIAKSLIELQKGKFTIEIDGDLFKAIIELPKHHE